MGNKQSLSGRTEPLIEPKANPQVAQANDLEVARPDAALLVASNVDSDTEDDLFKTMGYGTDEEGKPFFSVNGVPCYTRSQLDAELRKDELQRLERTVARIDEEGIPQDLQNISVSQIESDIEMYQAEYKRLRKLADKLEETKVEIIHLERKKANLEILGNVQSKRPIVSGTVHPGRYLNRAKTIRGQLLTDKIGEELVKYQKNEENKKKLDDGAYYSFLVTVHPTPGASNCTIELVGRDNACTVGEGPKKEIGSTKVPAQLPGSPRKRPIDRK